MCLYVIAGAQANMKTFAFTLVAVFIVMLFFLTQGKLYYKIKYLFTEL